MKSFVKTTLFISVFCSLACTPVLFNQKERLNDRIMNVQADPYGIEMRAHMILPREGSLGGFSTVGGGGCSCK